ncbi:ABSCISIC ACID-INSENSITIVE 5-like protein 6 [Cardamine amara subsp. amara]|uniref:ABSCISIC ACID-INSENSITIVE 5-like protein 6 n=1 Tax=Cardamine amara subsp. amara TaxID=228776 RepID=A0ABD1BHJ7_CARAN
MESRINFKNFVDGLSAEAAINSKQPTMGSSVLLTRQNSVFSLTFDEFQNSWGGGIGKDFGSMNMDELLKNIWTAEENQSMMGNNTSFNNINIGNSGNTAINNNGGLSAGMGVGGEGVGGGFFTGGSLQRQGSLTLPRTISQKTVDDVWKELMKEDDIGSVVGNGGTSGIPQRQQTLGEMTLEEFLFRAGVVREEVQPVESVNNFNGGFYGFGSDAGLESARNGFVGANQPHDFSGNGAVVRPDLLTTQTQPLQMQQQPQKVQQPQQLIQKQERPFTKPTTVAFSNTIDLDNYSQPATQEVKPSILGIQNLPMNNNLLQAVDFKTGVTVAAVSPGSQMSPDLTPKSAMDASLSSVPYMFGRVRKTGAVLEKVIERRQKRMIKNRESAARSRARKQAYTLELEAEVAQLKELNEELQRKQVEIMEKQKNELLEPLRQPWIMGCKRQCLRRTLTGPW